MHPVGLSRSRFYQLIDSAFPQPNRDDRGRPFYDADQQQVCLEVRRHNCGIDGRPVLFYAPRGTVLASAPKPRPKPKQANANNHSDILDGVRALGVTNATAAQVGEAVRQIFPNGTDETDPGEVIRQVFLSIKRQNSADNVG